MKRQSRTFVAILGCLGVLIMLHSVGVLIPFETAVRSVVNPFSRFASAGLPWKRDRASADANLELQRSYALLRETYQKQLEEVGSYNEISRQNQEFRELLGFLQKQSFVTVGASILGKNIDPIGNTVLIDRGEEDGLEIGDPVLAGKGFLIGTVAALRRDVATVRLLSDPESKVAVSVQNSERSIGVVEGGYGVSVRLVLVPQNETIEIGDIIVTSNIGETIPTGLVIGQIATVIKKPHEPFQEAILTLPIDTNDISVVSVVTAF